MFSKMTNVRLVSHSSVLIQKGSEFILTDPWFEKPAFGSWLPVPPMSIHPAYLTSLASTNPNFSIAVSHGHDDHLDDKFLSLFPKHTNIIIPEYKSKGVLSRLQRIGFKNIIQAPLSGVQHGCFNIRSYINMEISRDDAILSFEASDNLIVHANDNWQELDVENFQILKMVADRFESEQILYMSQCNLADGFPSIYRDYDQEQKAQIHTNRVDNIIKNSLLNANKLGAKYFINYAGHAVPFVQSAGELKDIASFKSNVEIQKACDELGYDVDVLNVLPGDSFNFEEVQNQFSGYSISEESIKQESYKFYESYGRVNKCDSYRDYSFVERGTLSSSLGKFLNGFTKFVEPRIEPTGFNTDIFGCKIVFICEDMRMSQEVVVGGRDSFDGRVAKFYMPASLFAAIMTGDSNWENLYIGYGGEVETTPKDTNIRAVVRWLAMYGYVYQRERNDW